MSNPIRTFIADANLLILEGLKNVLSQNDEINVVGTASDAKAFMEGVVQLRPEVLLVDYTSDRINSVDLSKTMNLVPSMRVVGISHDCNVSKIKELISNGLNGHLMTDCDRDEIIDSVKACAKGAKFFCGKVLDQLNESEGSDTNHGCEAVNISERELEVLQLIAQGLTAKQIGEKLHVSFHTVMTHRKNMMAKLGLNNTAGLIIYAVRENLISPNKFLFSSSPKVTKPN
ncbi:MAG: response regulator transcription factor [Salibacteraceae bacterium]